MILFLMRDCRKTHTRRTSRVCMYLKSENRFHDGISFHLEVGIICFLPSLWKTFSINIRSLLVLDGFTSGDTVWDVEVHELGGKLHGRGEPVDQSEVSIVGYWPITAQYWDSWPISSSPVDHLHAVEAHLHVDQDREVFRDLNRSAEKDNFSILTIILFNEKSLSWPFLIT